MRSALTMAGAMPIADALARYVAAGRRSLHTPAHRGTVFLPGLERLLTPHGLACDLPCMEETDHWHQPTGCIDASKRIAQQLYGAQASYFLVNGSTMGNQAMLLASLKEGDRLLLPRNFHISTFAALVMAGVEPHYIPSRWKAGWGPLPLTLDQLQGAWKGGYAALHLTNPSYYGLGADLAALAGFCHAEGALLLVDEAHGAHLPFLPRGAPQPAIAAGADLAVQSLHKTIGSLVGTAQLHLGPGSRVAPESVQRAVNLLQSTSPSNVLLASIDIALAWLRTEGRACFADASKRVRDLRARLVEVDGLAVPDIHAQACPGIHAQDPFKLVLDLTGLSLQGGAAETILKHDHGLQCEMSDPYALLFYLSPHDTQADYAYLLAACQSLALQHRRRTGRMPAVIKEAPLAPMVLTPRAAWMRGVKGRVDRAGAVGQLCGELVSVYPPGIPLICPGERITAEIIAYLTNLAQEQACVYASDPSLRSLLILA